MTSPLAGELKRLIAASGPITVARYMAEALGHPRHGYYVTRDPLGAGGDFVTAPEISQAFGELIGAWCATQWHAAGAPDPVRLVELGPGRGTLMADALRTIDKVAPEFGSAIELHLVETSPVLRQTQAAAIDRTPHWHDDLSSLPDGPLIVVANEFFDALPIQQLVWTGGAWRQRVVGLDPETGSLRFEATAGPSTLGRQAPPTLEPEEGAIFELCPAADAVARDLGERIGRHGGAALVIDYGHGTTGLGETLQAVRGHEYAEPLAAPGEADLTAHVDFDALMRSFSGAGLAVVGPTAQRDFLRALGIEMRERTLREAAGDEITRQAVSDGIARLIAPDGMGTLFKVLAAVHPRQPAPPGF